MNILISATFIVVVLSEFVRGSNDRERIRGKLNRLKTLQAQNHRSSASQSFPTVSRHLTNRSSVNGQPIRFSELNKNIKDDLYQGDLLLTENQIDRLLANAAQSNRSKRQILNIPANLWPTPIPYFFDPVLTLDANTQDLIRQAVAFWQSHTCIAFTELAGSPTSQGAIQFSNDSGCFSVVGYGGGGIQETSIGSGCNQIGIITHEINHQLGTYHEHSRYDRDSYVSIDFNNVAGGEQDSNFEETTTGWTSNEGTPYDYGSVMHYGETDFAVDDSYPNMIALQPWNQDTMGQRFYPTFNDIRLVNIAYNCTNICNSSNVQCAHDGYPNPANCSECICTAGWGGASCDQRNPGVPVLCGQTVNATCEWQILTGNTGWEKKIFGVLLFIPYLLPPPCTGNWQNVLYDWPYECWYHIQSPQGTQIELIFHQAGGYCSYGCFYGDIEVKIANFTNTGYRWCCPDDLPQNVTFTTDTNLAMIGTQSRYLEQTFNVSYRINSNCTDVPQTTIAFAPTTTLKATPIKKITKQHNCKCCDCDDSETYESETYEDDGSSEEDCGRYHRHKCDC